MLRLTDSLSQDGFRFVACVTMSSLLEGRLGGRIGWLTAVDAPLG